nr:probable LRR receptor-like serine/threonine-protein kinase At4g36180 [Ipomoea batatas]
MQCVFWGLLFILQWGGHECCVKEERVALLQIKAFFTTGVNVVVAHRFLPSWLEKGDNDCCTWERVTCNPITGHVTELSLDHLIQNCNSFSGLSLDVSLFSPFEELVNLELSGNCFSCCLHNQGFDKLKRVEGLNLAENDFGDNIFRSLGALTTLTSLNLSWNSIYGLRGGLQVVCLIYFKPILPEYQTLAATFLSETMGDSRQWLWQRSETDSRRWAMGADWQRSETDCVLTETEKRLGLDGGEVEIATAARMLGRRRGGDCDSGEVEIATAARMLGRGRGGDCDSGEDSWTAATGVRL